MSVSFHFGLSLGCRQEWRGKQLTKIVLGKVERPLPEVAEVIGDRARFIPDEQSVLIGAKAQALSNRNRSCGAAA